MTRRSFVAGAPAILMAQSPNDVIRVGIIGVGNRGGFLLRQILKVPNVKVVAICDLDPDTLKKAGQAAAAHSPELYTEYRKLLDRKDIDAVFIATPVDLHREMTMAALEVGKNIYCEKTDGPDPRGVQGGAGRVEDGQGDSAIRVPVAPRSVPGGVGEVHP